jgi:hypothetical protein
MRPDEVWYDGEGKNIPIPTWTRGVTRCQELFVEQMWQAYRAEVPKQPGAAHNYKWVWTDLKKGVGQWVNNPPPTTGPVLKDDAGNSGTPGIRGR